jgi:surface antigen
MNRRFSLLTFLGILFLFGAPASADWLGSIKKGVKAVGDAITQDDNAVNCSSITGLVGSVFGYGTAAQATSMGCLVGGELMEILDEEDQEVLAESTEEAIATGDSSTFEGENSGVQGSVTVTDTSTTQQQSSVAVLKDKVEEMPPLELIGAEYRATAATNVRGGPGTDFKVVDSLAAADKVQVIGKVENESWYLIGQGGVATGFVFQPLLEPTGYIGGGEPPPEGEVAEVEVATQVTCRTIEQEVTLEDGSVHTEQIEACQKPDGSWQMS